MPISSCISVRLQVQQSSWQDRGTYLIATISYSKPSPASVDFCLSSNYSLFKLYSKQWRILGLSLAGWSAIWYTQEGHNRFEIQLQFESILEWPIACCHEVRLVENVIVTFAWYLAWLPLREHMRTFVSGKIIIFSWIHVLSGSKGTNYVTINRLSKN